MLRPLQAALLATLLAGPVAAEPVRVVATIGMLADTAGVLAGDCATVSSLIPPGGDPHLYEATPSDIRRLQDADLVIYLGLGLEGRLAQVLARLAERRPVLAVGAAVDPARRLVDADGVTDPHIWMDPALWAETLPALADALAAQAPACAEAIAGRAEAHAAALAALDAWTRDSLASVPPARRLLVTAHDAFGYFGRAYGWEVEAVQGLSTAAEAAIADIRAVARLVAERAVPAVFAESTLNPRTVESMADAARALGATVTLGPPLFADAMGPPGTPEGTHIGMIVWNVRAITAALGGTPAPLPPALRAWAEQAGAPWP